MLLRIDHLVIAVRDPDACAAIMERDLGLAVTGGGRHEHSGTFNRLAFLGDTYLELIGVFDRSLVEASAAFAVARASLALLDEGREGLATYAVATDDVAAEVARLRAAGSPIGKPVPGSRTRPDGEVVRWATAFPVLGPERPPFLIEHELAGAEWGDGAREARAAFRHPAGGAVRLAGLTIPAADPAAAAARYRDVLGIEVGVDGSAALGDQLVRLTPPAEDPLPVVALTAEPGSPTLDVVRFGIRWTRSADATAERRPATDSAIR
ncbi:MAG TPA: VOC family protein [Candidatus Limnocylindrales bacterium]|nr:VOC family protein [Candidatus Limnocylindrales bacterium]